MKNFSVDDLSGTWATKFIGHVKSADFFSVDKYPTSKLSIKSVKNGKVLASLTVNGVTETVNFKVKKSGDAFVGKLVFDRTVFNINYGKDESLGDKFIHKDIELDFSIQKK
jgi:polyisoprenoid-binding protein YceI